MSRRLSLYFSAQPRCQMDGWVFRICLAASLYCVLLSSLLWLSLTPSLAVAPWLFLALPWLGPALNRLTPLNQANYTLFNIIGKLATGMVIPLFAMHCEQPFLLLILPIQSLLLRQTRQDGGAALVLMLAPVSTTMATSFMAEELRWPLLTISICLSLSGIFWVHARISRRRIRQGLRRSLSPEESWTGLLGRAALASLVAVVLMSIATPASQILAKWKPLAGGTKGPTQASAGGGSGRGDSQHVRSDDADCGNQIGQLKSDDPSDPGNPESSDADQAAGIRAFPTELSFDQALGRAPTNSSAPPRLQVKITSPADARRRFGPEHPLYLLNTTYDTFTPTGLAESDAESALDYLDTGDGRTDGWTRIRRPLALESLMELQLIYMPIVTRQSAQHAPRTILPRLEPLRSVSLPQVRYQAAGKLSMHFAGSEQMQYKLRCADRRVDPLTLADHQLDASNAADLELPEHLAEWQATLAEIHRQMDALDLKDGKVRAVLRHFKTNFNYQLQAELEGPASIHQFLLSRQGYCTYFATAATLALRSIGIPARVAAGYRLTRWDKQREVYYSAPATAHAWVEVKYKGWGWVPIDPTPGVQLERLAWQPEAVALLFPNAKDAEKRDDARNSAAQPDQPPPVFDAAAEQPASEQNAADRNSGNFGLITGLTIALIWALSRRFKRRSGSSPQDASGMEHSDYLRLLALLAGLGFRKRRRQTPLEFAQQVVLIGGPEFALLPNITMVFYADRFGGRQPDQGQLDQRDHFEQFLRRLKSRP